MAWYRTGTIALTNGGATVTGTGTAFTANAKVGDALHAPDGRAYEITAIASATSLTIAPAYLGTTASGQAFAIQPTRGLTVEFNESATALLAAIQSYVDGSLAGKFGNGTAGAPSITFASDTDLGLFRKAANTLGLAIGGVEKAAFSASAFNLDLPVTGTAVQSSETDDTAGRLLKVGAFGIGLDQSPDAPDLNTPVKVGVYRYNSSASNKPFTSGGALLVLAATGNRTLQIAHEHDTGKIATRWKSDSAPSSGSWTTWREIYTAARIVGTVSQSGGVPTGAIIETGSDANGRFTRFADGTQVCHHVATAGSGADTTWTFPAVFSTATGLSVLVNPRTATDALFGAARVPTTSAVGFNIWNTSNARQAQSASLFAIGRWF